MANGAWHVAYGNAHLRRLYETHNNIFYLKSQLIFAGGFAIVREIKKYISFIKELNNYMISAIKKRRSIREYLAQNIPDEKIHEILAAAMYAPSANAIYPWEFVIVKDSAMKEKLSKVTPWSTHAQGASVVIAIIGHEQESSDWVEDCAIVAEHIWLEATEQGLSSCWIQIRGNDNAEKEVKNLLCIPNELRVLCLLPIGAPATAVQEHNETEFIKNKIKYERY